MRRHLGIKSDCILEWGDEFSHFQSWTRFEILSAIFRVCLEIRNPQSTNLQETLFNATQIGVVNQLGCSLATNDLRQWFSRVNQSHFLRKCILKLFSHHWFLLGESNERSWAAGHFIIPNGHHWEDSKKMGLSVVIPPKTNGWRAPKWWACLGSKVSAGFKIWPFLKFDMLNFLGFLGNPWEYVKTPPTDFAGVFNDVSFELKKPLKITCQIWGTLFNSPKLEDLKLVSLGEDVGSASVFGENMLNKYSCRCQMLCTRPRFARESAVFVNDIWFSLMAFLFLSHMSILCHFTLLAISVVNFINPWLLGFVVSSDLHRKRVKNVHLTCEFAAFFLVFLGETEWPRVTSQQKRRF